MIVREGPSLPTTLDNGPPRRRFTSKPQTAKADSADGASSVLAEYIQRYSKRDVEGVTELCLPPFLAIREGARILLGS